MQTLGSNEKRGVTTISRIAFVLFLAGVYLKQFYILSSGSLQIGDILFLGAFFILFCSHSIHVRQIDFSLVVFIVLAIIVNVVYYVLQNDNSFLLYSSYLVFNLLIVFAFRIAYMDDWFTNNLCVVLKFALLTQLVISIIGIGRNYDASRYQGTFNDPNQFGYYILTSFFLLFLFSYLSEKKISIVWYIITGYLILKSASMGMFLGFGIFVILWFIIPSIRSHSGIRKMLLIMFMVLLIVLFIILSGSFADTTNNSTFGNLSLNQRIISKLNQFTSGSFIEGFLIDRSMRRILVAPGYFFLGSGEGFWDRFLSISGEGNEIHSTIIGLCYYYGIIPYLFFVIWVIQNLKNVHYTYHCVYFALIMEAFTLINHRQPFFWMILAVASHPALKKKIVLDGTQKLQLSRIKKKGEVK